MATSLLKAGDHVIVSQSVFGSTIQLFVNIFKKFGLESTFVSATDVSAWEKAVKPNTKLMFLESPANPLLEVIDIAAVADIAHAANAILCVDSTVATPIFTKPLALGADIVMHSATKYLNGHSDVVAGALVALSGNPLWERIAKMRGQFGSALSPFDSFLLMRGLRTLDVRVRAQAKTAAQLAAQLVGHPALVEVLYPGLDSHVGHGVAKRQMIGGFGGMFSVRIKKGAKAAVAVAANFGSAPPRSAASKA